jgi:hypothetical protein
MPDTHYSESYIKTVLSSSPWSDDGTRRVTAALSSPYTAWSSTGKVIQAPAVVTWIQNPDKSIDTIITD